MAEQGLVRVISGRPAILYVDGCNVYISVHDQNYLNRLKAFKRLLKERHPDHTPLGGSRQFRRMQIKYERFLLEEREWYRQFNLNPPPMGV